MASRIYGDLKIKEGEVKIILECFLCYEIGNKRTFSDKRKTADVSPREAFGFCVLNPPTQIPTNLSSFTFTSFFTSIVIFTPKSRLFDNNLPG
ncbi:MAG: hypothetical protein LBB21_04430 [Holosporaceae bacterium]|nr:hypothetical protein [Holosporaceae bacterium]